MIELPCVGGNGIYVEEEGGRSGPFCGNMRMPELVSRDVKFDIHVIIDTPVVNYLIFEKKMKKKSIKLFFLGLK